MWIKPSTPISLIRANTPNSTIRVTAALTLVPIGIFLLISSHGPGVSRLILRAILLFSLSKFKIYTSNSWPTSTTSLGEFNLFQDSSDIWIRPSAPFMSTKAPNELNPIIFARTIWPSTKSVITFCFAWSFNSCIRDLSDSIALFLVWSTSNTLTDIFEFRFFSKFFLPVTSISAVESSTLSSGTK